MKRPAHEKEELFIRLAARTALAAPEREEFERLIAGGLDWPHLLERARHEGVSSFIHHHLKRSPSYAALDTAVRDGAAQLYFHNLARNNSLASIVKETLQACTSGEVEAIVLKGSYLAEHIYKNIALRPVGDIDLLVKKRDLLEANDILCRLGYCEPPIVKEMAANKTVIPFNSLIYSRPGDPCFVHLHWHLINSTWPLDDYIRRMDMERIWSRADPSSIDGYPVATLSPEHQIVYLAHHALHHSFSKLIHCVDLKEALAALQSALTPELFVSDARRFWMADIVVKALSATADMLGCDAIMAGALNWFDAKPIAYAPKAWLWRSRYGYGRTYCTYLAGIKGAGEKARFLRDTLFPQRIVLANLLGLPPASVKRSDYLKRIMHNLPFVCSHPGYQR